MDVLKRVEDLLKSGDVTNLELLVEEEKTFFGGFRPVSFVQCLGPGAQLGILEGRGPGDKKGTIRNFV